MDDCFNVCYLREGIDHYPIIWGEDHYELDPALKSALDFARSVRVTEKPLPFIWVELGDFRFELHAKPHRAYRWELSMATTMPDESGKPTVHWGAAEGCQLWTRPKLVQFWAERERGEHRAEFPCAWDECDGFSRDLEPLMRDRYGVVYQCRKCREWTDSNCAGELRLKPYKASRASALT